MRKSTTHDHLTDAEIEEAIARGEAFERYAPRATFARYRSSDDAVVVGLSTGIELAIPRRFMQGLEGASAEALANVAVLGPGSTLFWESLDVAHGVASLLKGIFGNRRWMSEIGKRGGVVRSRAKARASRKNGRLGGRPRKVA